MQKIPNDYADRILESEMNLEESPTLHNVKALNELYGIGIDHYIDLEPIKARHLQKKMANLLSRPSILQILEKDLNQHDNNPPSLREKGKSLNKKLRSEVVKFHTEAELKIEEILKNSNKKANHLNQLKDEEIGKQEQQLNGRLLSRVKSEDKLKKIRSCKFIRQPLQGIEN